MGTMWGDQGWAGETRPAPKEGLWMGASDPRSGAARRTQLFVKNDETETNSGVDAGLRGASRTSCCAESEGFLGLGSLVLGGPPRDHQGL